MAPDFPPVFSPDADALLRAISRRIDDAMLAEISVADHGYDADTHLKRLHAVRDDPAALADAWTSREVLELTRWLEPDSLDDDGARLRAHWKRAFACALLLRLYGSPDNRGHLTGLGDTLYQCVASLDEIGPTLRPEGVTFLGWLAVLPTQYIDLGARAVIGVALLWLALRLPAPAPDSAITDLCAWIADCEWRAAEPMRSAGAAPGRWLFDATEHGPRMGGRADIGAGLASLDLRARSPGARHWVALIGTSLMIPARD